MSPAKVLFRVDAAPVIGHGHLVRCLALAETLQLRGIECHFACRERPGFPAARFAEGGPALHLLPALSAAALDAIRREDPATWAGAPQSGDAEETLELLERIGGVDAVVADHYGLNREWDDAVNRGPAPLMVMEDVPSQARTCGWLVDPTPGRSAADYAGLVPSAARRLAGPEYAVLRPQFRALREAARQRRETRAVPEQVLIMMGGADPLGFSAELLGAVLPMLREHRLGVTVVLGADQPGCGDVRALLENDAHGQWVGHAEDMAALMLEADLAIGAAGSATWERCCLGLPTVLVTLADNQRDIARAMGERNAAVVIDAPPEERAGQAAAALGRLAGDREERQCISARAFELVDGLGALRVALHLVPARPEEARWRPAGPDDARLFLRRQGAPPDGGGRLHPALEEPGNDLWIAACAEIPCGLARVEHQPGHGVVSIAVAPELRGLGLGKWLLHALRNQYPGLEFRARVDPESPAARRLFEAAGFTPADDEWLIRTS